MSRVYNFSAGPAVLPEEVLKEAADEMLDYKGSGMSVMEMSHRSKVYDTIIKEAEADLRDLMNIPDNYKVLFLQGGASQQFAMIPMNLMKNRKAAYIVTGQWAKKAYQEAKIYGEAVEVASSADKTFSYIPDCSDLPIPEDADYVYICENNTIYGTKFKTLPNTKGHMLVSDVSSCFLSEPVDVSKYGVIYGGVQKNVGPAGVVIVIIREDLITEDTLPGTPANILEGVERGIDFFDCVYPSRNGRHGHLYTNHGKINLFNAKYELDERPIEEGCKCPACRRYSRAYIRHLLKAKEMLGMRLCVLHNLYFYNTMMEEIRDALDKGEFSTYKKQKLAGMTCF